MGDQPTPDSLDPFYESLVAAASSGDTAGYAGHYMPNGVLMAPNRPAIEGREEIRAWFEKFKTDLELNVKVFEQTQLDVVGEVALVRYFSAGDYLKKKSQERVPYEQKYLDVLRWVDGGWLLAYHAAGSCTFTPGVWDEDWEPDY